MEPEPKREPKAMVPAGDAQSPAALFGTTQELRTVLAEILQYQVVANVLNNSAGRGIVDQKVAKFEPVAAGSVEALRVLLESGDPFETVRLAEQLVKVKRVVGAETAITNAWLNTLATGLAGRSHTTRASQALLDAVLQRVDRLLPPPRVSGEGVRKPGLLLLRTFVKAIDQLDIADRQCGDIALAMLNPANARRILETFGPFETVFVPDAIGRSGLEAVLTALRLNPLLAEISNLAQPEALPAPAEALPETSSNKAPRSLADDFG